MFATPEVSLQAPLLFDVVFFIVVVSAILQGTTLASAARWLGLERPREPEPPVTLEISSLRNVDGEIMDYVIREDSRAAGRLVKDLALPGGVVIAMITRGDKIIAPQGITRIHVGDHVMLVLRPGMEPLLDKVFGRSTNEPVNVSPVVEFPFRGRNTVGELEGFYSIRFGAPPETTLDEFMRRELSPEHVKVDAVVEFDSLRFRIMRISESGQIELVGMSILPERENNDTEPESVSIS
jgi:cell volume regulation protein A